MYTKTLIILDWDDTLFPTSWVMNNNINMAKASDNHKVMFSELDNILYDFLHKCLKLGKVIIVTNASYGWVNISLKVLPYTSKILLNNIKILSAREMFQKQNSIHVWKRLAFEQEVVEYFMGKHDVHNIVSIGDAEYEYNALIHFYDWKKIIPKKRLLKTIKLISSPTYYSLLDQIDVLSNCIEKICRKKKHVDLHFKNLNN
jgi:hypothetical protein